MSCSSSDLWSTSVERSRSRTDKSAKSSDKELVGSMMLMEMKDKSPSCDTSSIILIYRIRKLESNVRWCDWPWQGLQNQWAVTRRVAGSVFCGSLPDWPPSCRLRGLQWILTFRFPSRRYFSFNFPMSLFNFPIPDRKMDFLYNNTFHSYIESCTRESYKEGTWRETPEATNGMREEEIRCYTAGHVKVIRNASETES